MKGLSSIFAALLAVVVSGCYDKADSSTSNLPLLRTHFAGMTQVIQGTNASKLRDVWALPASQDVRKQALDKISSAPFQLWQKSLPAGAQNNAKLLRPLLDDLVTAESFIELNGAKAQFDSVIAAQLDDQRAHLWSTNLWQTAMAWKFPAPKPLATGSGWETHANGITLQFQEQKNWVLLGWSAGKLKAIATLAETAVKSGRPIPASMGSILELDADFPAISRYNPLIAKFHLPVSQFIISPHRDGEYLRTEGKFILAQPLKWKFEPWKIPTNHISDPLVSFTVAQPIAAALESIPGFRDLGIVKTPTQVCGWSQGSGTFRTYWAFPSPDASNTLHRVGPKLEGFIKRFLEKPPGGLIDVTNRSQIVWQGLPLMIPSLSAISSGDSDYILAGLLPPAPTTKQAPRELLAQFEGRTNLLSYDWEITENRLTQAKLLYQIVDMTHLRTLVGTNAPTAKWVEQAARKLGNTVTEVTLDSPKELKLVRKSPMGLTGFELASVLRWMDSQGFPLDYQPPPPAKHTPPAPKIPAK